MQGEPLLKKSDEWDSSKEEREGVAMEEEPLLKNTGEKGGIKAVVFILGLDALQKMASLGLSSNMILYLTKQYHMEMTTASNVIFLSSSLNSVTPVVGAIIADSYLGRFLTMGLGSLILCLGMILLWLTTMIPLARPAPCDASNSTCESATVFQFIYLCTSLILVQVGCGGISSCSIAFGVDQLDKGDNQMSPGLKERYFNWYYASSTLAVIFAQTFLVSIQDKMGWGVGYAVPAGMMFVGVVSFYSASPLYVKLESKTNLITGLFQVATASYRNRHLELSNGDTDTLYCRRSGSALVSPSRKLRFLNKACIITDPEKDLTPDGRPKNPWSLCTVDQVEELKALLKVIPIWSSGMMMAINMSQNSFPVLQAASMDRRIFGSFTIPAASFGTFTVVAVILWVVLYDRVFLPLASIAMGRPVHISTKKRMGFGIFLSFLSMIATAIVESIRRGLNGVAMSAMWLIPIYCLSGFADGSNMIAQIGFYFSELPRSMSSIASVLTGIGMSFAGLLSSLIMNVVDSISKAGGHESWIATDIDKGHYDYYYLLLAGLTLANLLYFAICSKAYGPLKEEEEIKPVGGEDQLCL